MDPLAGLGEALTLLRKKAGLTQEQVAASRNLSHTSSSRMEAADANPRASSLAAYLETIGADAWSLAAALDEVNGRRAPSAAAGRVLDELVTKLEPADALETRAVLMTLASAQARGLKPEDIETSVAEAARRMTRRVLGFYGEMDVVTAKEKT